jgi:hypothetical protein
MTVATPDPVFEKVGMLQGVLVSLEKFDDIEIRPRVQGLISVTERETCFVGTYYRAVANIRTAILLKQPAHYQAAAMLARTNIELAIDIRLLDIVPDAVPKMMAFGDSEKLRTAQKVVDFAKTAPKAVPDLATYQAHVAANEKNVLALRKQLWGSEKPPEHWSGKKVRDRATAAGDPFEELYEVKYRQLSFHTHAGLTGVLGIDKQTFGAICGDAFGIAATCYEIVLKSVITELHIRKADSKIDKKLDLARLLPGTKNDQERQQLQQALLG